MSPARDGKAECFAVRRGDLHGKQIGVALYAPIIRQFIERLRKSPLTRGQLKQFVDINPPVCIEHLKPESLVSFLPMEAVGDKATGEIAPYTRPLAEVAKGFTPFAEGDVIWAKITPCMQNGKTAVARNLTNSIGYGSTEFHVFRPKTSDTLAGYVWEFLSQQSLLIVAKASFTGSAGQQRVSSDFLESLPFPLPSKDKQRVLVAKMSVARVARATKLHEADVLLAGLDSFLIQTLGLTPPAKDERRVFAVLRTEMQRQRHLNPDYFHPERILALRAMELASRHIVHKRLGDAADFIRDQIKTPGPNYLSLGHVQSNTGELVASEEESSGACLTFKENDVLFTRLRPYLNKVYRAEKAGCCSTEFHVLRTRDMKTLRPDYLAAILRSSLILAQTRHMMTGNTHPRLTNEDVVSLVIPIPKITDQETIVTEARRRREEARRLRIEAESGWESAKRWFEEQLLGGTK